MTDRPVLRSAALAALVVVSVLCVVTTRQFSIGRAEVEAADAAAATSDWLQAVAHARAAAEARAPGSRWPERGQRRLEAIAHDAEVRGDDETALLAYGAMRTAAIATRGPGTGTGFWREMADTGLARVASSHREVGLPPIPLEAALATLRRDETPPPTTLALLSAGVLAMVAGLATMALRGKRSPIAEIAAVLGLATYVLVLLTN